MEIKEKVLVLDFGSQYTQLIARRVRELSVYCEIHPYSVGMDFIKSFNPSALIMSGGPASCIAEGAPLPDKEIFNLGVPILGICYGMQVMAHILGGKVKPGSKREYGQAWIKVMPNSKLFSGIRPEKNGKLKVWMSHGDRVEKLPVGFEAIASSDNSPYAAMRNESKKLYAVQFHPEVVHTPKGVAVLRNFLFKIAKLKRTWTVANFIETSIKQIRERVGKDGVVLGLSGGVDSSVAAVLIHRAIGKQLHCIFVDNGLLRLNEAKKVEATFRGKFRIPLTVVDASDRFLKKLEDIEDPEQKRKIIGETFIRVFEEEARKLKNIKWLAQGTLYPDVIESVSFKGPSAKIKSHHNVGGLPEKMALKLLEPFRELFKDEVRKVGLELGVPEEIVYRQPFPGPGLAVRILGEVTKERCDILRQADDIVVTEVKRFGYYRKLWQSFAVLLPIMSVGVMGDERTYENVIAVRAVESVDAMTADWAELPYELLATISNRIINEVRGVNRVVYDISSKPPATIEWE